MNAEQLRARNRFEVKLESGLVLTLETPNMLDCMIAVKIPVPIVKHLQEVAKWSAKPEGPPPEDISLEELGHTRAANVERIRRAVLEIDHEELELTADDVRRGFTEAEQTEILEYLDRDRPDPKAEST